MPTTSRPPIARRPFLARIATVLAAPLAATVAARRTAQAVETTDPTPGPDGAPVSLPDGRMTAFIGQIALMPYEFVPRGWVLCNGQELGTNDHAALFSLIGTNFGGDGRRTFRVPSLKPPYRGVRYMICAEHGTFPTRT